MWRCSDLTLEGPEQPVPREAHTPGTGPVAGGDLSFAILNLEDQLLLLGGPRSPRSRGEAMLGESTEKWKGGYSP
jgi:hypothetical protein